ncbi:MAG: OmpA family protein [bacterium]|nr:OmpA family protein [bacterium]
MALQRQKFALGVLGLLLAASIGCSSTHQITDKILGKDVAEYRAAGKEESCPSIINVHASPHTVECGNEVSLAISALAPDAEEIFYSWEIDGQIFDTGTHALWKTPTCQSIEDPQQLYTIRGVASDGECAVAQTLQVQVLCNCALDLKVNFEFGKAELDVTARAILDEFGATLQNYPAYSVLIEGHTDHIGNEPSNQALGERRSQAVQEYLLRQWGVQPERLMTMSFGEGSPVAPNETPDGRAKNRRAEIFRIRLDGN